jgi:stage II sporulation protein M
LFYPVGSGTFGTDLTPLIPNLSFVNIYLNNIKVVVSMIVGGLIFLGISTAFLLFLNGLILGSATYYSYGADPNLLYITLLPHGMIEVPSFLLAGFVGIRLPFEFYKYLIDEELGLLDNLLELSRLTVYVFLLLLIAALIESFLVPSILNHRTINWRCLN